MDDKSKEILIAAGNGLIDKVTNIISSGVDVNISNDIGYTPLMSAVRSYRTQVASYLIENGANVNSISEDQLTVLHHAVGEDASDKEAQAFCVNLLLKAGAKIDAKSNIGQTPLMWAAWFNCDNSIDIFLEFNADVMIKDNKEQTAIDIANNRGYFNIVAKLMKGRTLQ